MNMNFLIPFVDKGKLGGWVRALVASGLGMLVTMFPGLSDIVTPDEKNAVSIAVATLIVGIWSHYVKMEAKKK